ncbi:MAG: hypothetical protein ACE5H9_08485, partial [Anaerolineae bacterium]
MKYLSRNVILNLVLIFALVVSGYGALAPLVRAGVGMLAGPDVGVYRYTHGACDNENGNINDNANENENENTNANGNANANENENANT